MHTSTLPLTLALLSHLLVTDAAISPTPCLPTSPSVRLPPSLDPALDSTNNTPPSSSYLSPPPSFLFGTWYMTNSSMPSYRALSNLQWDLRPVLPSRTQNSTTACPPGTLQGCMQDLTTWAIPTDTPSTNASSGGTDLGAIGGGGRRVASVFGYDTPRRVSCPELGEGWDGVYDVQIRAGIEGGFEESWAVLYWGVDEEGVPFMVIYESDPECLDAVSGSTRGPGRDSLEEVLGALRGLGNDEVTKWVEDMGPVSWDYGLGGGTAICGEECKGDVASE